MMLGRGIRFQSKDTPGQPMELKAKHEKQAFGRRR
jgi:hypothetical protein